MKKAPDTEGALSPFRGELGTIGISHVSVTFRNGAITRLTHLSYSKGTLSLFFFEKIELLSLELTILRQAKS